MHPRMNDPTSLDVNAACFMMLTRDLPSLFGIMARSANRVIRIRDSLEFDDWLHVISDLVVVRIYAGSTEDEVHSFRNDVVGMLHKAWRVTLTPSRDCYLLSRNQVNVPMSALAYCLYALDARCCRVSFFVMKWDLPSAEPVIDHYIGRYCDQMVSSVSEGKNLCDYGLRIDTNDIVLIGFSEAQLMSHRFVEGLVNEMCDIEDLGSVSLNSIIDVHISRIKIYQELCHKIVCVVQRQTLDDMPSTVRTMRTRASELRDLIMG